MTPYLPHLPPHPLPQFPRFPCLLLETQAEVYFFRPLLRGWGLPPHNLGKRDIEAKGASTSWKATLDGLELASESVGGSTEEPRSGSFQG